MNAIPKLLEEVAVTSARTKRVRETARAACVTAIRRLELALVEALAGESLRNLPNLALPPARFCALRVRGRSDEPLERDSLVLVPSGRLVVAGPEQWVTSGCYARERVLDDAELMAEDVEHVARTVERAARLHLDDADARVAKAAARFEQFERLAEKLHAVVDAIERKD